MQTSISQTELIDYVSAQTNAFFPDRQTIQRSDLAKGVPDALMRVENCFSRMRVGRYFSGKHAIFNHLYSDQYLMFLWFLSNSLWRCKISEHALNKVYLLNKCLHGFDCAFDTSLPDIFVVIHGVGTVLGKASYSNYLVVYQGCTVGQTQGKYPSLGLGVGLGAGAAIIGNSMIGNLTSIGAGCTLINAEVEANSSVFRDDSGNIVLQRGQPGAISKQYFSSEFLER